MSEEQSAEEKPVKTTKAKTTANKTTPPKKTTRAAASKPTARKTTAKKTTAKKPAASKKATTTAARKNSGAATKATPKTKTTTPKASASKAQASKATETIEDANIIEELDTSSATHDTDAKNSQSDDTSKSDDIFTDLKDRDWKYILRRGLLMILFGVFGWIAFVIGTSLTFVHYVVAILQDGPHKDLVKWINTCGTYLKQVFEYLSYETDEPPFPFGKKLEE